MCCRVSSVVRAECIALLLLSKRWLRVRIPLLLILIFFEINVHIMYIALYSVGNKVKDWSLFSRQVALTNKSPLASLTILRYNNSLPAQHWGILPPLIKRSYACQGVYCNIWTLIMCMWCYVIFSMVYASRFVYTHPSPCISYHLSFVCVCLSSLSLLFPLSSFFLSFSFLSSISLFPFLSWTGREVLDKAGHKIGRFNL